MKVAIDISSIIYGTGVSVYTRNLVETLHKIDKRDSFILFGGSLRRRYELTTFLSSFKGERMQSKVFPIPPTLADFIWNKLHIINIEKLIGGVDVFHSSDWTQPPTPSFKVTTIHDLVPLKYPKLSHPRIVSAHSARMKWIIKEVDRVIVPSKTTMTDSVKLGVDAEKIRVIPEAADPIFKSAKMVDVERLKRKYRISGKYLLSVGIGPRKNTERLIRSFEKIKAETGMKLVIVGHKYVDTGQERGVIYLGHVSQIEMPILYSGAEAFTYPSLYEGFGLPILEAFACKTPIVTSDFGSMKEVAGNGAVLVDPYNVESITEGIRKALNIKNTLIKKGISQIKKFSWEKTARETLKVYQESEKSN